MKKNISGARRKTSNASDTNKAKLGDSNSQLPAPKSRKYDDKYLALGFRATMVGHEERPVCADSLQLNKLKRHLGLHPTCVRKSLENFSYFKGGHENQCIRGRSD